MKTMNSISRMSTAFAISALTVLAGCAGGGASMAGANPALGSVGQAAGQAAMGAVVNSAVSGVTGGQGGVMNALIQSMAQSVLHGQIGQQVAPADQNFRLQQLGGLMQSGAVNQPQQWSNPQTGNVISVHPLGQPAVDPHTRQNCRDLEEVYTSTSGQTIRETRRACQDQTGRWVLVQ
jgi:surface antigen